MGDVGHKEGGKTTCYEALDLISQPAALITSGQLASTPDSGFASSCVQCKVLMYISGMCTAAA